MRLPTIPTKLPTIAKFNRLSKKHKITTAGAAAAAAVVLTVTGLQATAGAGTATAAGDPTGFAVSTGEHVKQIDAKAGMASQHALKVAADKKKAAVLEAAAPKKVSEHTVLAADTKNAKDKPAAGHAQKKAAAPVHHEAAKHVASAPKHAAAKHAAAKHATSHAKKTVVHAPRHVVKKVAKKAYANNLDGWIRESLDIMHSKGIPGSYEGIHRNIIRESSGNPQAINLWDINARNGIPSKGLLQVINPTFDRYHVSGTSWNIYNPVANITAACNYAADRYGTMDNVNSAY